MLPFYVNASSLTKRKKIQTNFSYTNAHTIDGGVWLITEILWHHFHFSTVYSSCVHLLDCTSFFCTFPSVIGHSQIVFVLAIETFTVCTFTEDVEKQVVNIFVKFYVKDELSLEMLIYNFIYLFFQIIYMVMFTNVKINIWINLITVCLPIYIISWISVIHITRKMHNRT